MKTKQYLLLICVVFLHAVLKAQVKIGDNSTTINSASLLELETTNKGFVLPRVSITDVSAASPLPAGLLTGTVVYNTNSSTTGGSGVGVYYWDGSKWNFMANTTATAGSYWALTGNSGLSSSGNFIGTTDAADFVAKTANTERMRILGAASGSSKAGWIGMGVTIPRSSLDVTGHYSNKNVLTIQNSSTSGYSSVDMMDSAGNLAATFGYANLGTSASFTGKAYFNGYGNDFLFTRGSSNDLLMKGSNGYIGINTGTPSERLHVVGNIYLNGAFMPGGDPGTASYILTSAGANTSPLWKNLSSLSWSLTGNSGTSYATNFLGTTDNVSMRFRTNNVQRMIIDSLGRVGIGLNNPSYTLSVLSAANPLYLSGVQATSTFSADSVLTINGGIVKKAPYSSLPNSFWSLTGNAGTSSSTNFLGTTDNVPLIVKTNNTQNAYFDPKNNVIFGQNSPGSMTGNYNLGIGSQVMNGANSGNNNVAIGTSALNTNSGNYNIAVGASALSANQGSYNFAIGDQTLNADGNGANYNVAIGNKAMSGTNSGSNNLALGTGALNTNSGNYNVAIGSSALYANVGSYNLALGDQALYSVTAGGANYNVAIGSKAMNGTNTGANNLALGTNSLNTNSGNYNISVGAAAMVTNQGSYNFALGSKALDSNAFGANYNLAVGYQVMSGANSGSGNFAFGTNALNTNSGSNNFGFGNQALLVNQGQYNFAFGYNVMTANTSGQYNFAYGSNTFAANTTGSNNIAIGSNALGTNTTGSNNIGIGQNTDVVSGNVSNAIAIGKNAKAALSNSLVLGDTASGGNALNVGIGVRYPLKRLHIDAAPISNSNANDSLKIDNLASSANPGNKSILVRDSVTGYVSNQSITTLGAGNFWSLTGNSGTVAASNFLGTTDNVSMRFRTNNIQRMKIDSIGSVAIGSTNFDPYLREKLLVDYGTTTSNNIATFKGSINDYLQIGVQNQSSGTNASSDIVATSDDGTDSTNYIDMGINSSTYAPGVENFGGPHDGYLYSYARNLLLGAAASGSDIIFLVGGGQLNANSALRISGTTRNIIVGRGENGSAPIGNTVRGPNAASAGTNLTGGSITLAGGSSTGTATGGGVNINGGNSVSGTAGTVGINTANSGATNINAGSSTGNLTLGSTGNNILLPKFTTVGGLYYTSVNTGQISTTGANMTWDSINNRLGIGISNPSYKLSVLSASNPLYLSGVQATSTFTTDSVLTINAGVVKKTPYSSLPGGGSSGWSLTGNSGTSTGTNFLGTTDGNGLVFKVNGIQAGYLGLSGSSYSTSLGVGASGTSTGFQATAIGAGAQATQNDAVAIGYNSSASVQDAIAIGQSSAGSSNEAISIGHNSKASAYQSIALGVSSIASSNNETIAIGTSSTASGYQGIALGYGASATSNNQVLAVGVSATATGYQSTAVGNGASATAMNSTAIGNGASTSQTNAFVLGNSSTNVGVGTSTPNTSTKLDVSGSYKLGSNGTVTKNSISFSTTISSTTVSNQYTSSGGNSNVTYNGNTNYTDVTFTLASSASNTQATVSVSPASDLPDDIVIAFARLTSTTQGKIRFMNLGTNSRTVSGTFYITVTDF